VQEVAHVEELLTRIEDDPAACEAVAAVVELYGEALRRIVERVAAGEPFDKDELLSHLLVLHDLHPVGVEGRVEAALDEVRPYLRSHGGDVELVAVEDDVAKLRLAGTCNGCPSSSATMRLAVEEAVLKAAPELSRVEAEGATGAKPALLQLGSLDRWSTVGGMPQLAGGEPVVREVGGERLLFARVGGTPYAYRGPCPACGAALDGAELAEGELVCSGCGRRFDLRRAGRCLDAPSLSLEPVPLLESEAGLLKVAT
jgi:Fe-S cluster biogenesis protein NfuA/nitrite reductase/ring-hydroxylating ferredoxin subunit